MELIRNCVAVDILAKENGRLDVSITAKSTWSGSFAISDGVAVPTRKDPSQFVYKVSSALPRVINRYLPFSGVYQVLQTDYTNYAVIYSCTNFELVHSDLIWIWGRRQEINAKTRADIYSSLQEYSLDSERLILPKDDNCTDY
ncbi:hypothetical protein NQ317_015877 [Molorchus minor]|uniref:Lipocalin/cytosolic fatty-acid binding domain-containing protein n=1 Tax=Molorchus minor TaxID=1323400 RepID=A0ABQ9J122_9CUCU|nr:hypothetical protein NQ317_015877 [Molorchus minor]